MLNEKIFNHEVKYQIFVSSTFKDLGEPRKIAMEAILKTGNFPIALERFTPRNKTDREVIENAIKNCDIFLLILGHRYGELFEEPTKNPNDWISYTEYEYNLAFKFNKPILTFILDKEDIIEERKNWKTGAKKVLIPLN